MIRPEPKLIEKALRIAYKEALKAYEADEVPIGAAIVFDNEIISKGRNRIIEKKDPTAHAEILAIQAAAKKIKNERLVDCHLFTTLEPCAMCSGAVILARIKSVFFLAKERKLPALRDILEKKGHNHYPQALYNPHPKYDSSLLLKNFFQNKR